MTFLSAASFAPPSVIMRSPITRDASTNVVSFINVRACSGVFVRVSRTVHASRPAESNSIIDGGALDRFQNVYRLRR
jgi:hypothetical protein